MLSLLSWFKLRNPNLDIPIAIASELKKVSHKATENTKQLSELCVVVDKIFRQNDTDIIVKSLKTKIPEPLGEQLRDF